MTYSDIFVDEYAVEAVHGAIDNQLKIGAIGTGDRQESSSNTDLENQILEKQRAAFSSDQPSGEASVSLFINSTEANGETIREFAFEQDEATPISLVRKVIDPVDKNNQTELFLNLKTTVEVTQSDA